MRNSIEKIWLVFTLLCLFIRFGQPQHMITESQNVFYIVNYSLPLLLSFFILIDMNIEWLRFSQVKWILLLVTYMVFNAFYAYNSSLALRTTLQVMFFIPFVLSMARLVITVADLKLFTKVLLMVGLFVAFRAVTTYNGTLGVFNIGEYLQNPNSVSLFFSMLVPFSYVMAREEKQLHKRLFYFGLMLLFLIIVVITKCRTGFITILFIGGIIWLYSENKKIASVSIITVGLLIIAYAIHLYGNAWIDEMHSITQTGISASNDESTYGRLDRWLIGVKLAAKYPLGAGARNSHILLHFYDKEISEIDQGGIHSLYFTQIAEFGYIGLFLILALFASNIRSLFHCARIKPTDDDTSFLQMFAVSGLISMFAFILSSIMESNNFSPLLYYMTAFFMLPSKLFFLKK